MRLLDVHEFEGQKTNFETYDKALKENGGDVEKAAFATFTGKMAAEHGFVHVKVETKATKIEATFSKTENYYRMK